MDELIIHYVIVTVLVPFSTLPAKICGEDGMVDPNCFVIAQSVVFSIMEQQYVLDSPVFMF